MLDAAITKFDDQTEIQSNNLDRLDLDHEQQNSERLSYGTNEIEIRVLGLQRSGNHALITWITAQYPKKSWCFLNNIKHGDYDPHRRKLQDSARISIWKVCVPQTSIC